MDSQATTKASLPEKAQSWAQARIEAVPDPTVLVDSDGNIQLVNQKIEELLGYSREELTGQCLDILLPERFRERHKKHLEMSFKSPVPRQMGSGFRFFALHKDGREVPVDISLGPLEAPSGLYVVATLRNITLQLEVEKVLRDRLEFEMLITDLSARLASLLPEQVDDAINNAFARLLDFFQADRAGLLKYSEDFTVVRVSHGAANPGMPRVSREFNFRGLFPFHGEQIRNGKTVIMQSLDDLPPEAAVDRARYEALDIKSLLGVPLFVEQSIRYIIVLDAVKENRYWSLDIAPRLRLLGELMVSALIRKKASEQLDRAFQQLRELKDRLESENVYLRDAVIPHYIPEGLIANSDSMKKVLKEMESVAPTDSTVLLFGETGTGKEMLARAIHNHSPRKDRLMITVNCAALPPSLIESELFGREKGAYTGALSKQVGRFEIADLSTLLLDEVAELPLDLQSKLLRVLQFGEFERLGSSKTVRVNVRIIAATNRDLPKAVQTGAFRKDLYYRLSVFPLMIPPLRERPDDIPALVWSIVNELGEKMGKRIDAIPKRIMEGLQSYSWPGNVRELRNVIEHSMILATGKTLEIRLPDIPADDREAGQTLEQSEHRHILHILQRTHWRLRGKGGAAEILGVHESTLRSRMKKLGIQRPS